jgi:hypothetical protein
MEKKLRGWKEGIITQDLKSWGSAINSSKPEHKKGDLVRYKKYKQLDEKGIWNGEYEYHYTNLDNGCLVRTPKLLIEESKLT